MEVTTSDKVVLVMGATGAGKSTIVKRISGDMDAKIGHGLQSGETNSNNPLAWSHD